MPPKHTGVDQYKDKLLYYGKTVCPRCYQVAAYQGRINTPPAWVRARHPDWQQHGWSADRYYCESCDYTWDVILDPYWLDPTNF